MALVPTAPLANGLRLGSVAEVCDGSEANGLLGQIVRFDEGTGDFEVCLTTGNTASVHPEGLRVPAGLKRPGQGGEPGSFDLLLGPKLQEELLGEELAACLFEKGFCVLRACQKAEELEEGISAMRRCGDEGHLRRLPEEVEEGYLGINGCGRVAWLDPRSSEGPKHDMLEQSDALISTIASVLQPHCADMLGKFVTERTPALASLLLSDEEEGDYPPQDADDRVLGDYLRMWRRSQIKVVTFLGPSAAKVSLESTEEESGEAPPGRLEVVELELEPGSVLVFRTGIYRHEVKADDELLTLSATLLSHAETLVVDDLSQDAAVLLAGGSGPSGPTGPQVCVVNMSSRLMAGWDETEGYRAGLMGGTDSAVEIPFTRFDVYQYYNPDDSTRTVGQMYLKHMAFVEGLELFDNKYFDITTADARVMSPMQRQVLEVGANNLFKMGITKKESNRKPFHGGISVGLDKDDWHRCISELTQCYGGINEQAIVSNRFSYIFNLRGPNYVADTACSASLCATHLGKFALMDQTIEKLEFHIAIGLHQCHMPWGMEGQGSKMNDQRCFTFNESANGYMRGDGCSGVALKYGDMPQDRMCIWRASRMGQNGRSATLTAPNGVAQEEVILKTLREAGISAPESTIWNCHGTGTSLGDPIEVGGVRRIQSKEPRSSTLLMCTNKTHTGHLEGGAAMTSIIAAVYQVMAACACAMPHLNKLNPNLDASAFDYILTTEITSSQVAQNNQHISSFGFGGTNGHAILWGFEQYDLKDPGDMFMRRLWKMSPPEVRVNGDDPSTWEWDGPDENIRPGDKYSVTINPSDANETAIRWTKDEEGADIDDGEDDFYCITGPFNEWEADRMEDGAVTGLRTAVVEASASGVLQFRFLKNGEEDQVLFPEVDKCSRKTAPVLGPAGEDDKRNSNTWLVECEPHQPVKINLFICRSRRSVMWMPAE